VGKKTTWLAQKVWEKGVKGKKREVSKKVIERPVANPSRENLQTPNQQKQKSARKESERKTGLFISWGEVGRKV